MVTLGGWLVHVQYIGARKAALPGLEDKERPGQVSLQLAFVLKMTPPLTGGRVNIQGVMDGGLR